MVTWSFSKQGFSLQETRERSLPEFWLASFFKFLLALTPSHSAYLGKIVFVSFFLKNFIRCVLLELVWGFTCRFFYRDSFSPSPNALAGGMTILVLQTYIGPMLVSVNPFQVLSQYGEQLIPEYTKGTKAANMPHLYAIAQVFYSIFHFFKGFPVPLRSLIFHSFSLPIFFWNESFFPPPRHGRFLFFSHL